METKMTTLMTDDQRNNVADIENIDKYSMKITTATLINKLNANDSEGNDVMCNIVQAVAFTLLPWQTIDLPTPRRRSKRIKLKKTTEFSLKPGAIFSVRFEGLTRGLIRSQSRKFLKNSVSIDIVVSPEKYINVKLSSCKLHMCGPQNREHGEICAGFIMKYLYEIQDTIEYVRSHVDESNRAFEYAINMVKGDQTERSVYREQKIQFDKRRLRQKSTNSPDIDVLFKDGNAETVCQSMPIKELRTLEKNNCSHTFMLDGTKMTEINIQVEDHRVSATTMRALKLDDVPVHIDKRCLQYFAFNATMDWVRERTSDYCYYEDWLKEAEWLRKCTSVYSYKPHIGDFPSAMTNYNFGLGFSIDRAKMANLFDKHPEFTGDFDNMRSQNVKIELPYFSEDNRICRKNKSSSIIFIVYKTGKVTLTGPLEHVNMLAFREFVRHVQRIRKEIEKVN